jgi:hypothetical protein
MRVRLGARKLIFGLSAVGAALVVGSSAAWACTNLATLNLSSASGTPGSAVTITGSSFAAPSSGGIGASAATPVQLHWNSVTGNVLTTVVPDQVGNISATVKVPQAQPGYYTIVGTQITKSGTNEYGTPARASFQVISPGQRPTAVANAFQPASFGSSSPSSTGVIALTVALGVAGLALFGAAAGAFARQTRRQRVPAAQKAEK